MLTTEDNPYNPYTHFDEWQVYDLQMGYNTLSYLARVVHTAPALTDEDEELAIEWAIDEILKYNILGNYKRATPPS